MNTAWSPEVTKRYRDYINHQSQWACNILCWVLVFVPPAFTFQDYLTHHQHFVTLLLIRLGFIPIYLGIFFFKSSILRKIPPHALSAILLGIVTFQVCLLCYFSGGFKSVYIYGLDLIILGAVMALPYSLLRMATYLSSIILLYICMGLASKLDLGSRLIIIDNLTDLISMSATGMICTYYLAWLRKFSFDTILQMEEAKGLEVALKQRNDFISMASHELKTPLTSLKLLTDITLKNIKKTGLINQEQTYRVLNTFNRQLGNLNAIVSDMLDITKIDEGRLQLNPSNVDLCTLISQTIQSIDVNGDHNIQFLPTKSIHGSWDSFRLEQVLTNLITNAIKYGDGKRIDILLDDMGDEVCIQVVDQGIGVKTDQKDKIFLRYERGGISRDYAGLGLGLYITKNIILAHGGKIQVLDREYGGSIFRVELPKALIAIDNS